MIATGEGIQVIAHIPLVYVLFLFASCASLITSGSDRFLIPNVKRRFGEPGAACILLVRWSDCQCCLARL